LCGIVGVLNIRGGRIPDKFNSARALASIIHRGPDDEGTWSADGVFLGARRLSIIDVAGGHQPVTDEQKRFHLVMNGEIFDYDKLLEVLKSRGHRLVSHCDTEVAVHMFEESWFDTLDKIDGQFAVAVYDEREKRLLLARDRMGICPLFYTVSGDLLIFASEIKAILATGLVTPKLDLRALDAVTVFGSIQPPNTAFEGVKSLAPGHYLQVVGGRIAEGVYWDLEYPDAGDYPRRSEKEWISDFYGLMHSAVERRLKADVPVGIYLSGGIDSSTVAALCHGHEDVKSRVFSIGFAEKGFDESDKIRRLADYLGLETHLITYSQNDLAMDFPRLIYHGESPLISTESIPLMALSGLARQYVKVVLTGEGSDEALGGYSYFRWEEFKRVLKKIGPLGRLVSAFARRRFGNLIGQDNPLFPSAATEKWANDIFGFYPAGMVQMFYYNAIRKLVYSGWMFDRLAKLSDADLIHLDRAKMSRWDHLNRSLYVSSRTFMTNHLLGSHGDRALMANSVEGRYPFLDRTVQEFLLKVPPTVKTSWRTEKRLLRNAMKGKLPSDVIKRRKQPFLAPFGTPFVGESAPDYARELLSVSALKKSGYFDADNVVRIARQLDASKNNPLFHSSNPMETHPGVAEHTLQGMSITFVLSVQVLDDFIRRCVYHNESAPAGSCPPISIKDYPRSASAPA
jgi:asparagine synthase (glutamine-hydrolysing)